jgi:hypothetical protein
MDESVEAKEGTEESHIWQAHSFFRRTISEWADVTGDPDKTRQRLSLLAQALQQHLQVVAINLTGQDDEQLIFEALNDRGTPLLAADLIKNYVFQQCEEIGADVESWSEKYWQEFDDDWWRGEVAQGRFYRSRIDLFLQYWLTMRRQEEIPTDAVFSKFKSHSIESLQDVIGAEFFLKTLRRDADTYRRLVANNEESAPARFYGSVVESLELGAFIPLLLWLASDSHAVPSTEVAKALNAIESWAIRRTLVRMTMRDVNRFVVSILSEIGNHPLDRVGDAVVNYLTLQTADARLWPRNEVLRSQLPSIRLYGNVKQSRLRLILSRVELRHRSDLTEPASLPPKLEIEHVMPRGWRTSWGADIAGDGDRASKRDELVNTLGNLTLVTKKLNVTLSNRPWRDEDVIVYPDTVDPEAGKGKRSLLGEYSILVLNKEVVDPNPDRWTEEKIRNRSRELTEDVIAIWPGASAS